MTYQLVFNEESGGWETRRVDLSFYEDKESAEKQCLELNKLEQSLKEEAK